MKLIGTGGTSRVYLAEDLKLSGKLWAVKEIVLGGRAWSREWEAALRTEVQLLSRLNHPVLPVVSDYLHDESTGSRAVVMEYIDGVTLQHKFEQGRMRMTPEEAVPIALAICEALHYLHSVKPEPVIYRDLKPANIMIEHVSGRVRLIDLGIARRYKPLQAMDTVCLGTPGFASPEQLAGKQTDARSDLYSLGAMLYYLLSEGQFYDPRLHNNLLHPKASLLSGVLSTLLASDPEARYADAQAAGAALSQCLQGNHSQSRETLRKFQPLIIAVGSLYSGAGSTFSLLALSSLLRKRNISHAVTEASGRHAELYAWLQGSRNAPEGYRCYNLTSRPQAVPLWKEGNVLWFPAAPVQDEADAELNSSKAASLLEAVDCPLWLVDMSSCWHGSEAQDWLEKASEFICIIDPHVHKLELPHSRRNWSRLEEYAGMGKQVHVWANRCIRDKRHTDWLRLLPQRPSCSLPAVEYNTVIRAGWDGRSLFAVSEVARTIEKFAGPWLDARLASWRPRIDIYAGHGGTKR